MLRRLGSNDDRFKEITFQPGLNIIVAVRTVGSSETDTRNGSGKSSIIELLHFLLGAQIPSGSVLSKTAVRSHTFRLEMDWPRLSTPLRVDRSPSESGTIVLTPDVSNPFQLHEIPGHVSLAEWQALLEQQVFGLPAGTSGVSGRAMLSLYMRRIGSHAFNDAVKTHPQQATTEAAANIAYLLGLDYVLALRYRDLAARESTRRKLTTAAKDPVWGRIVGRSSELRGKMTVAQQRVRDLAQQVGDFRVVPEYERLQAEADEIDRRIRQIRLEDAADRRNLQDLVAATTESVEPDTSYLYDVYAELGIALGGAVRQRFEDVQEFHRTVIQNRQSYLADEISSIEQRLFTRQAERDILGEQHSQILQTLSDGGALDALTAMQESLSQERATLAALQFRFEAAQSLEASRAEIVADRSALEAEMRTDIRERERMISDITILFLKYVQRLYGDSRTAYLEFDPTPTQLKIIPHIDSQDSRGIGNMVIFCFDLTIAVVARRAGRGPDFLVHDSHLFDGVDERQVARAMQLAREVTEAEGIQFIATMNSDDLSKAIDQGFDPAGSVIPPELNDQYEDGGVFGFAFV